MQENILWDRFCHPVGPDGKWRFTKIVTLLPRPYRDEYFTLPSSESSKNFQKGISKQENILWDRFCASRGTRIIEHPLSGVG